MAFENFLCLGSEIINGGRTCQFISDGIKPDGLQCRSCCPCPDIDAGLGYAGGYNITEAPWYVEPDGSATGGQEHIDSLNFAGLLVTSIEGLTPGEFVRPITESAGYGAILGQGRQNAPQIVVTGILIATTCCAQEYGYRWLRNILKGTCTPGCGGDDLTFLDCAPETPDLDCPENANFDFEAWLEPYYRTMKGVALVSGPTRTLIPRACPDCYDCPLLQVTFTLAASKPCIYRNPVTLLDTATFDCSATGPCIEWVTTKMRAAGAADCDDTCSEVANCATDPDCTTIVAPPTVPQLTNPCDTDCISAVTCTVCVDIPGSTFPANGEGVLVITIDNSQGKKPIRRMKIRTWQNPLDRPADELEDCDACSELNVSYLAPGAVLTIDGANETATISCAGGASQRANPFISSGTGSPSFSYPVINGCDGQYTVCVQAAGPIPNGANVTIEGVGREC